MRKKVLAQGALALLCLILRAFHWGDERPRSLPIAETFAPTDGFRTAVSQLVKVPEFMHDDRAALRMLGRRPLAFYLALEGRRFSMVASEKDLTLGPIGLMIGCSSMVFMSAKGCTKARTGRAFTRAGRRCGTTSRIWTRSRAWT